jgi:DNA mismatch repair protein MutL
MTGFEKDRHQETANIRKWEALLESIEGFSIEQPDEKKQDPSNHNPIQAAIAELPTDASTLVPVQLWHRYILVSGLPDLLIVDQRAAHERVIFENLLKDLNNQSPTIQKLLWPETVETHAADAELLKELLPHLQYLGFDMDEFGHNTFIVHGIPAVMTDLFSPQQAIEDILHRFREDRQLEGMKPLEKIAVVVASNLSRRRGEVMTTEEMQWLIGQLLASGNPYTSPTGRRTFITFGKEDIFRKFQNG